MSANTEINETCKLIKHGENWKYKTEGLPDDFNLPPLINVKPMRVVMDYPNASFLAPFMYTIQYHGDKVNVVITNPKLHDFTVTIEINISSPNAEDTTVFIFSRNDKKLIETFKRLFKGFEFIISTKDFGSQDKHLETIYLNDEKKDEYNETIFRLNAPH
jgi:hypothetical protein